MLTMGAGDIYKVGEMILEMDQKAQEATGKPLERVREYKKD